MTDEYEMEYAREDELLERITELEEENAKLKAYNEKLLNGDIEKHNKIVEFEKKISVLLSCKNCPENKGGYICQKEKDKYKQAKEIIKRLMDIINHDLKCFDTMAGLDIKQKAEQFLKECE